MRCGLVGQRGHASYLAYWRHTLAPFGVGRLLDVVHPLSIVLCLDRAAASAKSRANGLIQASEVVADPQVGRAILETVNLGIAALSANITETPVPDGINVEGVELRTDDSRERNDDLEGEWRSGPGG